MEKEHPIIEAFWQAHLKALHYGDEKTAETYLLKINDYSQKYLKRGPKTPK